MLGKTEKGLGRGRIRSKEPARVAWVALILVTHSWPHSLGEERECSQSSERVSDNYFFGDGKCTCLSFLEDRPEFRGHFETVLS